MLKSLYILVGISWCEKPCCLPKIQREKKVPYHYMKGLLKIFYMLQTTKF